VYLSGSGPSTAANHAEIFVIDGVLLVVLGAADVILVEVKLSILFCLVCTCYIQGLWVIF
jgi:hypothetical protein